MGQQKWKYTSNPDSFEQFVLLAASGREKFSENPADPAAELRDFLDQNSGVELLILPSCSHITLAEAQKNTAVIVLDNNTERARLFEERNPSANSYLVRDLAELRKVLFRYKLLVERAAVRCYLPSRYAHLDPLLTKLLFDGLLQIQKEYASFAASRSMKRWHTNTNLVMNLRSLTKSLSAFPKLAEPFVIVGAGPSLDVNSHVLAKHQKNAYIVATDGALQSLYAQGIKPDFIVSAEDTLMSWRFVAGLDEFIKDIPLVVSSKANHLLIENYPGPVILSRESVVEAWFEPFKEDLPVLECGRCVGHMAFNLALACGASEIIMTGFDLAYRDDKFHPESMPIPYFHGMVEPVIESVLGIDGNLLKTDISMLTYLRDFEYMIEQTDVCVLDATEGGAKKEGAKITSLQGALSEKNILCKLFSLPYRSNKQTELERYLLGFLNSIDAVNDYGLLVAPFTSYLLQQSDTVAVEEKEEDLESAVSYLQELLQCPLRSGRNRAFYASPTTEPKLISWAESSGMNVVEAENIVEAIRACRQNQLGQIYCSNGEIPPDLLMLADVEVVDLKTTEDMKPYERCLWVPGYRIMAFGEVQVFWRELVPGDILVEELTIEECVHGSH